MKHLSSLRTIRFGKGCGVGFGLQRVEDWPEEQKENVLGFFADITHMSDGTCVHLVQRLHPQMQLIPSHMSSHETGHDVAGQRRSVSCETP